MTTSDKERHQNYLKIISERDHGMQIHPQLRYLAFSYIHIHGNSKSNNANDIEDDRGENHFFAS